MHNTDENDLPAEIDSDLSTLEYKDDVQEVEAKAAYRVQKLFNENGTIKRIITAPKSTYVHHLIHLDGGKFDFRGREYLKPLYDRDDKQILLKTARQVEKTTFLGNNLVISSVVRPYSKSLYVAPSHTQTRQFSNEKLRPAIEKSPFIKRYFQDSSVSSQVFEKGFTNGSYVFLRSAFRSADRTRGISARNLCLDELQDLITSEIPVIVECTSHFEDANVLMAGTPKSHDNPIELYWQESTQNEWLVPCRKCGHWNYLDDSNIAPTEMYTSHKLPPGPVCKKCMTHLVVPDGQWMSLCPGKSIVGYRIPQLMVPWIITTYDQWLKLLWKRDHYPISQFYNEVLGISYDSAAKPITRDELMACCHDYTLWDTRALTDPKIQTESRKHILIGGIDWGEGNDGSEKSPSGKIRNASYTVFSVGHYVDNKHFKIRIMKKYTGKEADPDFVVRDVLRICREANVRMVGADWGHGWGVNNQLIRLLGPQRVALFQYLPKLKKRLKWDNQAVRYMLQRNLMMSECFFDMKQGFFQFPKWAQFEDFAKDILAIYKEYSEYLREIRYDHRPSDPDDSFHSLMLCKLMADIHLGRTRAATSDIE